jgi:hypothetical protein
MTRPLLTLAVVVALAATGCGPSDAELVAAVKGYNQQTIQAYRTLDYKHVTSAAGPDLVKRVAALVGVRSGMGLSLDAQLLDFEVTSVLRTEDGGFVRTKERWHYVDRKVGTGEQVGQESTDRYEVRYTVARQREGFMVLAAEFDAPPQVGRTEVPGKMAPGADHFGGGKRR